jgi:hypothetical protein
MVLERYGRFMYAVVELYILQPIAGHRDPAVTSRYPHPDVQGMLKAGTAFFGLVVPVWSPAAQPRRPYGVHGPGLREGPDQCLHG